MYKLQNDANHQEPVSHTEKPVLIYFILLADADLCPLNSTADISTMGRRPSTLNHRLDTFGEIHKRAILFDNEVKKVGKEHEKLKRNSPAYLSPSLPQETRNEGPNLHYGDRFIPRRRKNQSNSNTSNGVTPGNEDCAKANGTYAELLRSALDLKVSRQLILNDHCIPRLFFARQGSSSSDRQADDNFYYYPQECFCSSPTRYKDLDWMCKPRKKPAVDANSSHEFRGFSGTAVGTQIEWAWTGHIVSYWQNSLLLWNPDEDIITKYELEDVVTLAYHPHSHFLATSNHHKTRPSVNVWSLERGAMQKYFSHRPRSNYMITTLCWHKHGIHLLTGNVEGVLSTLDFSGTKELFHSTPAVHSMIKDIKFSATAQYVASLDILGKLCIWSYNSGYLMLHHTWDSGMSTNHISMDWHPWTDFDIVLCIQRGSMVLVLNILSKQTEAYSTGRAFKFDRPVVSFNRYSAELVVGCQRKGGSEI